MAFAASSMLGGRPIEVEVKADARTFDTISRFLPETVKRLPVWAALTTRGLHLRASAATGYREIQLPLTSPVLLEVEAGNVNRQLLQFTPGRDAFALLPNTELVRVRTLTRDRMTFQAKAVTPRQSSSAIREYAIKESRGAIESRRSLSAEQRRVLDEVLWDLADNPLQFESVSMSTGTGQMVYKHPTQAIEVTYSVDTAKKILFLYHFAAPLPPRQTIFISYSHQDIDWVQLLRKYLGVVEREGLISFWDDSSIQPGELWEDSFRGALDAAVAVVLLVSQNYLTSKFITTYELPRLLSDRKREGKKVFWIPIRPSTVFESNREITVFQALTDDPNVSLEELTEPQRNRQLVQVARRIRGALSS
jgi:hypothetical protein